MNRIRRTFPRLTSRIALAVAIGSFSGAVALSAQCTTSTAMHCQVGTYYLFGLFPWGDEVICNATTTTVCN